MGYQIEFYAYSTDLIYKYFFPQIRVKVGPGYGSEFFMMMVNTQREYIYIYMTREPDRLKIKKAPFRHDLSYISSFNVIFRNLINFFDML